jgi:hypothetical protein
VIALHLGAQLDHYRIEGVAARSGMASLFRSTDLRNGRSRSSASSTTLA